MALPAFDELMVEEPKGLPAFEELEPETTALPSFDELEPVPAVAPEVVQQEAQRATVGGLQALDVMAAPRAFDWSEVNEQLDAERFREAEGLRAQGQPERADEILATISPYTQAGQYLASQRAGAAESARNIAATAERGATPSDVLGRFLGGGLSTTIQPIVESGARHIGPAIGSAIGAARFIPHPGANMAAQILMPMAGALGGAHVGGAAQETVLRSTETPEETIARQQRAAEDFQRNPGLSLLGSSAASLPFFRPGLAQFGRAAAGDIGAIRNIGITGTMGAGMEVAAAMYRGDPIETRRIAEAFFLNSVMNEPTRLGRRLGLQPSSEQLAVEEMQARYADGTPPLARGAAEPQRAAISDIITPAPEPTRIAEVFPVREVPVIPLRGEPNAQQISEKIELMSPEQFDLLKAERERVTPERAAQEIAAGRDPSKLVLITQNERGALSAALKEGRPVNADLLDRYNKNSERPLVLPEGYIREGNLYIKKSNAQQISETSAPDGGVRAPQIPPQDVPLPAAESGEGVQQSGQGRSVVEGAPEAPRQVVAPEGIRYDGVTQMGDEGFYSFSDTTSIPGRTVSITIESTTPPTPEQIRTAMDAELAEFRGAEASISPQPQTGAEPAPPSSGGPAARVGEEGPKVTGIRNTIVDQARAEAGMAERELPARRAFGPVLDEAKAIVAQDADAGRRLVDELKRDIRPLTDTEDALLTLEQNRREIAREEAIDAVNRAKTEEEKIAAQERLAFAENEAFDIYQVGQNAGTANARGLNARRIMLNRDYTLAKMLNETRAVRNKGEPLSEAQVKEVTALHKRIAELEKRITDKESEIGLAAAKEEYRRTLRETKEEARIAAKEKRSVVDFFEAQAEKARQRIIARRGRLHTTIDPLNLAGLVDEAIIGASYLAKGVRDFAEWSTRMVKDFGERIRPQLKVLFDRASEIEAENSKAFITKTTRAPQEILGEATEINPALVRELTRSHIRAGVDGFENVMSAVEANLKSKFPEVTTRQIHDALSGYGKSRLPSKAEDKKKLAEYRSIARLLSQLEDAQAGQMPKKTGQQRDKPTARVRELQKQVNDAIEAAGLTRRGENDLASRLDAAKSRIRNSIEELQRKIERNDYAERPKREQPVDRERIDLEFELAQVKQQYQKGLIEARRARRTRREKIWDTTFESVNLSRLLLTSGDLPPLFRQGLMVTGSAVFHPVKTARALKAAFQAMVSEKQRFAIDREIRNRENAPLYERAKLYLAKDTGQTLNQQEEAFMGNWFKELPRWTLVGPWLRASERSYNTFLNKLRADTFDAMVKAYDVAPTDTATLRRMADLINTFTGRAKLPGRTLEQGAGALNLFFFATRFMASRFKVALGEPLWTGNAKTRKFALEQYGRTLAGALIVYGLAKMAGASVETDPRSTDFLKIRFGNTRLDPLGGLIQVTNFMTRLITGETKTAKGVQPLREDLRPLKWADKTFGTRMSARGKPSSERMGSMIGSFLRTKLSPAAGAAIDLATGKDVTGKPVTPGSMVKRMAVPISFQDILKTMEEQGVPKGPAMWILSLFGMGLQTYDQRK